MARVFLSYRRADGQYAVGWIAERLAAIGADPMVEIAFRDGHMRGGDDFPEALTRSVRECDVLIAVIGPHWAGQRPDGSHRILDPTDWVGREVASALDQRKIVIPVLIDGARPVTAAELPPEFARFADLNAVVFDDDDDLEALVDDVRAHLHDIDERRARLAGLDEEIVLASPWPPPWVLVLSPLVGMAAAGLGLVLTVLIGGVASRSFWAVAVAAQFMLVGLLLAPGWWYDLTRIRPLATIRWGPVVATVAGIIAMTAWGASLYGGLIDRAEGGAVLVALGTFALLGPWILIAVGGLWITPRAPRQAVRERTILVGELARASLLAASVLSLVATAAVVSAVGTFVTDDGAGLDQDLTVVTYGVFLSGIIAVVLVYGRTRLEASSADVRASVADLAPQHRSRVERHLIDEPIAPSERWVLLPLSLPVITGIVLAVVDAVWFDL